MTDKNNSRHSGKHRDASKEERSGTTPVNTRSSDRDESAGLDEKSSAMGRGNRRSGLSTKDGLTGSDLDGQVTD